MDRSETASRIDRRLRFPVGYRFLSEPERPSRSQSDDRDRGRHAALDLLNRVCKWRCPRADLQRNGHATARSRSPTYDDQFHTPTPPFRAAGADRSSALHMHNCEDDGVATSSVRPGDPPVARAYARHSCSLGAVFFLPNRETRAGCGSCPGVMCAGPVPAGARFAYDRPCGVVSFQLRVG